MANMPTEFTSTPVPTQDRQLPAKPYLFAPILPTRYPKWREGYASCRKQTCKSLPPHRQPRLSLIEFPGGEWCPSITETHVGGEKREKSLECIAQKGLVFFSDS